MIDHGEIEHKAHEFEINTSDVQRDYVLGWILNGIYAVSDLKRVLVLKGGCALRKGYYEETRYSSDLDFSTQDEISHEHLLIELNKVCNYVQDLSGVEFQNDMNRVDEKFKVKNTEKEQLRVLFVRLYFKDFYGNNGSIIISIRMDVKLADKIYLPVQTRQLIHPYSDHALVVTPIRCVKAEEIIAWKIKCLLEREHIADLYDLVHALSFEPNFELSRQEIVTTFFKKTVFERSPHVVKGLLLGLPLEAARHFWEEYVICPKVCRLAFDGALEAFASVVDLLFGEFRIQPAVAHGRSQGYGFPIGSTLANRSGEFRPLIYDAGRQQHLLRITYDGIARLVEPYSLVFKAKKEGTVDEYLYVWDRTGGKSGPGIKCFIFGKIQNVETTQDSFSPRFEIEIVKSSLMSGGGYFSGSFPSGSGHVRQKPAYSAPKKVRSTFSSKSPGMVYIIQCGICGKKFKHSTYNTSLASHKDKYGSPCYGRTGYLADQKWT